MATLQVRSMDDHLYHALGLRAAMDHRSISQEVIAILTEYLARPVGRHQHQTERFLQLCGTWQDERTESEIADGIRQARNQGTDRFAEPL